MPFENLDIHLGRPISLEPCHLAEKLIERRRGGYCFELNGVFAMALDGFGFAARRQLARVVYGGSTPGARLHQVMLITLGSRRWLGDTGFGAPGLRTPIPLELDRIEEQFGERFRLVRPADYQFALQKESDAGWLDLYVFTEEPTIQADIDIANHYTSTHPLSSFRLRRVAARLEPWGRVTLHNMTLTTFRNGHEEAATLDPGRAYMDALVEKLGLDLRASYDDFMPLPA